MITQLRHKRREPSFINNSNVGDDSALAALETFTFLVITINYAYFSKAFLADLFSPRLTIISLEYVFFHLPLANCSHLLMWAICLFKGAF